MVMLSPVVPAPLLASPLSALIPPASKIHHFVMDSVCACLAMHGSAREADLLRGPACDMLDMELSDTIENAKIRHLVKLLFEMGPLPAVEDLRAGVVCTHPTCPGSAREADLVRGPAYDGVLSPAVPAPLLAPPSSTLLPTTPKIHHLVMDGVCACLAMHGSAREADLVRGPACDVRPFEMGSLPRPAFAGSSL